VRERKAYLESIRPAALKMPGIPFVFLCFLPCRISPAIRGSDGISGYLVKTMVFTGFYVKGLCDAIAFG
jgi:hypothetical protein